MSTESQDCRTPYSFPHVQSSDARARRLDIPMDQVNLLNPDFLSKFTSETGKILPRRVTGLSAKMHRKITVKSSGPVPSTFCRNKPQGKSLSVELSLQAGVCPVTGQIPRFISTHHPLFPCRN